MKYKYVSGGLSVLIGVAASVGATQYNVGALSRMGPGFYPAMIGVILILIGLLIMLTPDSSDEILIDGQNIPLFERVRPHLRS